MKKRILIPLLCLCAALLFAGGLALLIPSGFSIGDALGVFLEKPFEKPMEGTLDDLPNETEILYYDPAPEETWCIGGAGHEHQYAQDRHCVECDRYKEDDKPLRSVEEYDDAENLVGRIDYDADGNVIREIDYAYEYYENGDTKHIYEYVDGVLGKEIRYVIYKEGEYGTFYHREVIIHLEDGGWIHNRYDAPDGYLGSAEYYNAEGNLIGSELYEYRHDAMGRVLGKTRYVNGVLNYSEDYFRSPCLRWYCDHETFYDENGNPERDYTYEYERDEDKEPVSMVKKLNGAVIGKVYYRDEYGYGQYIYREITYGENGEVLTDIYYDPEGNEISP